MVRHQHWMSSSHARTPSTGDISSLHTETPFAEVIRSVREFNECIGLLAVVYWQPISLGLVTRVLFVKFLEDVAVVEALDSTLRLGWIKRMREAELALSLKASA